MGTFHVRCKIENPSERSASVIIPKLLVDTGSEFTWVSERMLERIGIGREKKDVPFVLANGQEVTRSVGFAIICFDNYFTIDEVVFAEPGDLQVLGARTLGGLNLVIEPVRRTLVAAGPLPAATPTRPNEHRVHNDARIVLERSECSNLEVRYIKQCHSGQAGDS